MRIPHYLTRSPSGRYTFRLLVPTHLRAVLGRKVIKHALHTTDTLNAHAQAVALFSRYAQAFRGEAMTDDILAKALQALSQGKARDYVLERDPMGNITKMQADGPTDHKRLMEALALTSATVKAPAPAPAPTPRVGKVITLAKARDMFLASIEKTTIPKTYTIKKSAIDGFTLHAGGTLDLPSVGRVTVAEWVQSLRASDLSTPTIVNKLSYLRGFFTWAMGAGYYPKGDNIAQGHATYSQREKRTRRKFGFKALTLDQVRHVFAPDAMANLSMAQRWATLIGLYTGARVAEVGQMRVSDIVDTNGVPCFSINDEGEGQSLKTDASVRVVPIHPDLLTLGFLDFVRTVADPRLFPNGKQDAKNGAGAWITKAFSQHLKSVGATWPPARRGFHSLRKTIIHEMQTVGIPSEMRAQIVGHELDDVHHAVYSREYTSAEKLDALKKLNFGLDLPALSELLASAKRTK